MATKQPTALELPEQSTEQLSERDERTARMIGDRLAHALELGHADPTRVVDRLHAIDRYLSFGFDPEGGMHDLIDQAYEATPYGDGPEVRREQLHDRLRSLVEQLLDHADTMTEVRTAARLLDPDAAR